MCLTKILVNNLFSLNVFHQISSLFVNILFSPNVFDQKFFPRWNLLASLC